MAVYKDNATGTWRVIYRFTNWKGERKQTQKRGFATKREAQAWEHEAMLKQGAKLDMTFGSFFEVYEAVHHGFGKFQIFLFRPKVHFLNGFAPNRPRPPCRIVGKIIKVYRISLFGKISNAVALPGSPKAM